MSLWQRIRNWLVWFGSTNLVALAPAIVVVGYVLRGFLPHLLYLDLFDEDAGHRLNHARELLIGANGRTWLPFLQLHIAFLSLFKAPYYFYRFIPLGYCFIFLFAFSLLGRRVLGPGWKTFFLVTWFALTFVQIPIVRWLRIDLYQELLVLGLAYVLLLLLTNSVKHSKLFYFLVVCGMFTRENFWIYNVAALCLIFWESPKLSPKLLMCASPLLVPCVWWLLVSPQTIAVVGNDNISLSATVLVLRLAVLAKMMLARRIAEACLGLTIVSAFVLYYDRQSLSDEAKRFRKFFIFTAISTILTYGYVVIFNPWATTQDNPRQLFPLLIPIPALLVLCAQRVQTWNQPRRSLGLIVLCLIPLAPSSLRPAKIVSAPEYTAGIENVLTLSDRYSDAEKQPLICAKGVRYWKQYVKYYVPLLLNQQHVFLNAEDSTDNCDILLENTETENPDFELWKVATVAKQRSIWIYRRAKSERG